MATKMLSIPEAAEALGVTPRWVRRAIFERRVAYVKLGHLVRIDADDIHALIAAGRVAPEGLGGPRRRVGQRGEPLRERSAGSKRPVRTAGRATRARQPAMAGEVSGRFRPTRSRSHAGESPTGTPGESR